MLCFILGQRLSAGITQIGERKFLDLFSIIAIFAPPKARANKYDRSNARTIPQK